MPMIGLVTGPTEEPEFRIQAMRRLVRRLGSDKNLIGGFQVVFDCRRYHRFRVSLTAEFGMNGDQVDHSGFMPFPVH